MSEYLETIPKKLFREHSDRAGHPSYKTANPSSVRQPSNCSPLAANKKLAQRLSKELPGDQNKSAAWIARELKKRTGITQPLREYENSSHAKEALIKEENTLAYSDAFPYLFFKWKIEGLPINHQIKHLVIDEMQDYSLLNFIYWINCFPVKNDLRRC